MQFYAHSSGSANEKDWQPYWQHAEQTSQLARLLGAKFGAERAAALAGSDHDIGKISQDYLDRLRGLRGSVDHSTAGAWHVLNGAQSDDDRLMAELVAFCIAGHHTGLPDKTGSRSSLTSRLDNYKSNLDPIWATQVCRDRSNLKPKFNFVGHDGRSSLPFRFGMLGRFLFSCLVDADYADTAAYYDHVRGRISRSVAPSLSRCLPEMIGNLDRLLASFASKTTDVALTRREILEVVRAKATKRPGLFTLNVPTGGGKTLTSLAFALDHAKANGMDRIIYGIPFTSIIDQTAEQFRSILGSENVLEHHCSAFDDGDDEETSERRMRVTEKWDMPVVVTTNVQLFESLMTSRPSKARKLHNIARSIIILDEAQTLPLGFLTPCVAMMDELVRNYGCTVILCTATQPALDGRRLSSGHPLALDLTNRELAPDPYAMAKRLRRVTFCNAGLMTNLKLVDEVSKGLQSLVIVNTRKHAADLYNLYIAKGLEGAFHLSTRQTAYDRRRILAKIKKRLKESKPCRVVSTSLIEAGVDVDFPRVWRCEAGLEQIAQAAGRCNREGLRDPSESIVTIFSTNEYDIPNELMETIQNMRYATRASNDYLSPAVIEKYFLETYWRRGRAGLDVEGIMNMFRLSQKSGADFQYRKADKAFRLIDSETRSIIIPNNGDAALLLKRMDTEEGLPLETARKLQVFAVQVRETEYDQLLRLQQVEIIGCRANGRIAVLKDRSRYSPESGLMV